MKKKEIVLIVITAILATLYVYYFTDWFASKTIRIQHTIRPYRDVRGAGGSANRTTQLISFVLDRNWALNEVKVVPQSEWQTNKYAHPVWHLVADSKSAPTKAFIYGGAIRGMHPAVAGIEPESLSPGVVYLLLVRSGKVQGEAEFQIGGTAR
jgi:hypothetical protein